MNQNLQRLRAIGQSLWLDNITRQMLDDGTLERWIAEYGLTGLTSNPSIFDEAIGGSDAYDAGIREKHGAGASGEALFLELALEDLRRAADLFAPVHEATGGVDGWVSLEVSPLLADDAAGSVEAARRIHAQAGRRNLFVKIPGTPAGNQAIEEAIYQGVPINVTLLFSTGQYLASAEAYLRGIERRLAEGLDPVVESVASVFVSRWDRAIADSAPDELRNGLGIAMGMDSYRAYRELLASPRWKGLEARGAHPQRLLWASTSTKDPSAPDTLYIEALAAPDTINTMPPKTLQAFAEHGDAGAVLPVDGGDARERLQRYADAGVDTAALAQRLQEEGAEAFVKSWRQLLARIDEKAGRVEG